MGESRERRRYPSTAQYTAGIVNMRQGALVKETEHLAWFLGEAEADATRGHMPAGIGAVLTEVICREGSREARHPVNSAIDSSGGYFGS